MTVLKNSQHEQFALSVAKGVSASRAYVSAGYSATGATASASRLLTNAKVCTRVRELQETLSAGTIALEISSRNARVQALQNRWDRMREGLNLLLTERGADMAEVPGGSSGLLTVDYRGNQAMPVYKVDTGLLSLLSELRALEKQAAEELGQWTEKRERPGDGTTAPTSITVTFVTPDKTPAPPEAATS